MHDPHIERDPYGYSPRGDDQTVFNMEKAALRSQLAELRKSHDRLLAACKVAVEILDHDETCDLLHAAIAAAEEEP